MSYGWIIDRDHLAEAERLNSGKHEDNAKGTVGPRDIPDWMNLVLAPPPHTTDNTQQDKIKALREHGGKTFRFKLYDDDNILYYSGRMITDEFECNGWGQHPWDCNHQPTEAACYSPLRDFGMGYAGCTSVRYPGHPDMDC